MHLLIGILGCFLHRVLRGNWHYWKEAEILDSNLHLQDAIQGTLTWSFSTNLHNSVQRMKTKIELSVRLHETSLPKEHGENS